MRNKYEDVYLVRYLNGERNFKNERTVFNHYETSELLGETQAAALLQLYAKGALLKAGEQADITRIQIDTNDLDKELDKLKEQVLVGSIGADDDTFDYFPDLVFAFQQICELFKKTELYNEVAKILNDGEYDELGEPFATI